MRARSVSACGTPLRRPRPQSRSCAYSSRALASGDATQIATSSQISEETIGEATRPLTDANGEHTVDGRWIRWQAPGDQPAGVQFDAFAAQARHSPLPAWTFWGDGDAGTFRWALHFSPHAAASVLQDVAFEVANGLTQKSITARPWHPRAAVRAEIHAQSATQHGRFMPSQHDPSTVGMSRDDDR
jgi:hypothetical protein